MSQDFGTDRAPDRARGATTESPNARSSAPIPNEPDPIRSALAREEWQGTRFAILGKAIILGAMTVFLALSFATPALYWPLGFIVGFSVTGVVQIWIAMRHPDWIWVRALLVAIDAGALCVVIVTPNPWSGLDLPAQVPYRGSYFALLLVYIASVGYSYLPSIALVASLACAAFWGGLAYLVGQRSETMTWSDIPVSEITRESALALIGQPTFFDNSARTVEIIVILIAGVLISGLVWRSRAQVRRLLRAEREQRAARAEQRFIRETFGKYVPESVAAAILADRGQLQPQKREATVLFVDIAGFTVLGDRVSPDLLIRILNAYFDAAGAIITRHGGTINQFQGDAILASFNVPLPDPNHAANALAAARELVAMASARDFEGERLSIRIGVNTGELAAGAVGSTERLSYTVHGNCVNVAARLEQLNKELGTSVLLTEVTARLAGGGTIPEGLAPAGEYEIRGVAETESLYTLA